ncbi:hypothetical protein Hanom_Chr10g00927511 [Helianthus anomalus]
MTNRRLFHKLFKLFLPSFFFSFSICCTLCSNSCLASLSFASSFKPHVHELLTSGYIVTKINTQYQIIIISGFKITTLAKLLPCKQT